MGRKVKYSKKIKLQACKDYEKNNLGFKSIANNIGTSDEVVRRWYLTYKEHGANAF